MNRQQQAETRRKKQFTPKEIRRAAKVYMQYDVLPQDPRLRQIVVDLLQVGKEMDAYPWDAPEHQPPGLGGT